MSTPAGRLVSAMRPALEAAQAAARALDVACMQAFGDDTAMFLTVDLRSREEEAERTALRNALTTGVTPETLLLLLRSGSPRNVHLAVSVVSGHIPDSAAAAARAQELHTREMLRALLDAALSAEAKAPGNLFLAPPEATLSGVLLPGVGAANVVLSALKALSLAVACSPRPAARLEAVPQRDALLRLLSRAYKPSQRRADETVSAPLLLHMGALSVLLAISAAGLHGHAVLWNSQARPSIVQELLGCLEAQACALPLPPCVPPSCACLRQPHVLTHAPCVCRSAPDAQVAAARSGAQQRCNGDAAECSGLAAGARSRLAAAMQRIITNVPRATCEAQMRPTPCGCG